MEYWLPQADALPDMHAWQPTQGECSRARPWESTPAQAKLPTQVLTSDASPAAAAAVMNRLAKLSARFIGERGFSIGIDDVRPAEALQVHPARKLPGSWDPAGLHGKLTHEWQPRRRAVSPDTEHRWDALAQHAHGPE